MSEELAHQYQIKPAEYYAEHRGEMLAYVPGSAGTILDVGCSIGLFGEALKQRQRCEVWGVEMFPDAAAAARLRLDRVIDRPFSDHLDLPQRHFDCIIFNDCLEHMAAPEEALRYAAELLRPDGRVVSSIPNMRYFPVMRDLLRHGRWEYADSGVLDRTHLRFFTQHSIAAMFQRTGFAVERLEGINPFLWGKATKFRVLNAILLGAISDMRFQQFAVVARLA
jgi:2-polyprenyl-3-methyl-5-hydroxy-6-metoxy-1,4-benzoquinol methylase